MMANGPTRKEVALQAGVSEATVSRVYNFPKSVAADKVLRVKNAAKKLNYIPNKYASALRRKGSGVILFLEKRQKSGYQWTQMRHYNSFYAEIIRALTQEAEKTLYHLDLQTVTTEKQILKHADPKLCDGIIGFNFETETSAQVFKNTGVPYICCHHTESFKHLNTVSTDNFFGGKIQAQALKEAGYQNPVYVTGALVESFAHQQRLEGFQSVWLSPAAVIETEPTIVGGRTIAEKLLKMIQHRAVDSIGVVNDLTAIGIIQHLMKAGLEIPGDVAIIGYDNLPVISALPFDLTTIDLALPELYKKAFRALLEVMRGKKDFTGKVKPKLCTGNSL